MLFDNLVNNVELAIEREFKAELRQYNMRMRGTLLNSLEVVATDKGLDVMLERHGVILNNGVSPQRIPYTIPPPFSGAGHSKYIDGLKTWFKIKHGKSDKEALGLAFGLARKHKKNGLPLDKRKIGWLDRVQAKTAKNVNKEIELFLQTELEQILEEYVNKL